MTEEIVAWLQRLNVERGVTLVMATRNPRVAGVAGRIVELRDGEVVGIYGDGSFSPWNRFTPWAASKNRLPDAK